MEPNTSWILVFMLPCYLSLSQIPSLFRLAMQVTTTALLPPMHQIGAWGPKLDRSLRSLTVKATAKPTTRYRSQQLAVCYRSLLTQPGGRGLFSTVDQGVSYRTFPIFVNFLPFNTATANYYCAGSTLARRAADR